MHIPNMPPPIPGGYPSSGAPPIQGGGQTVDYAYNNWLAENGLVDTPENKAAYEKHQASEAQPDGGAPSPAGGTPAPAGGTAPPAGGTAPPAAPAPAPGAPEPAAPGGDPNMPVENEKRPPGDNRSAQDIINETPVLKQLGNQSGVRDKLKALVGDFENDPDAAFRAAKALKYIDGLKNFEGNDRPIGQNNTTVDGFTAHNDARHGTEAGVLKDFVEKGYGALPQGGKLPKSSDPLVTKNGNNIGDLPGGGK